MHVKITVIQELEELALANISQVDSRESLLGYLRSLNNRRLHELAHHLNLLEPVRGFLSNKFNLTLILLFTTHIGDNHVSRRNFLRKQV